MIDFHKFLNVSLVLAWNLMDLINGKLVNKSNFWKSNNEWAFEPAEGSMVFVKNVSKAKEFEFPGVLVKCCE